MKSCSKFAATLLVLAASALPAFAQSEPSENVTVFAPYVVKKTNSGRLHEQVTTISVSRDVSFQGLDLTSPDGQATLEARVKQAANDVCRELDRRYPTSVYVPVAENRNCVKQAMTEAMMQVRGVEKAARAG